MSAVGLRDIAAISSPGRCCFFLHIFTIWLELVIDAGDTLLSITSACYTYEPVAEEFPITTIILMRYANTAQPFRGIISVV